MADAQNICIRLHGDEPERWTEILRRGRQRDPHASKSDIARALFKFEPFDDKLLDEKDRKHFQSKRDDAVEPIGRALNQPARLRESKGGKRKTG